MVVWLVDAGDDYDTAWEFIDEAGTSLPCLLDLDEDVYSVYEKKGEDDGYAPFPLQVVIDREGVITYLEYQYDAERLTAAIDAAVAD